MSQAKLRYMFIAAVGAIAGAIVGYLVYATGNPGSVGFGYWIQRPLWSYAYLWALIGAALAIGARFSFR